MALTGNSDPTTNRELAVVAQDGQDADAADVLPDGGYGWVVVASCFTLNGFTWGVTAVSACQYQCS